MTEEFDSVMSDETKYKIVGQLARLLALTWTAQQGRPVPPWRGPIDSDGWFEEELVEVLQLWFPDLVLLTEWDAIPPDIQAWVREETGAPAEREPENFFILYWPWAQESPEHAQAIDAAWSERMVPIRLWAQFRSPYIGLFTEDLFPGDDSPLDLAHKCQALRSALELHGYHDPEEDVAS